MRATPLPKCLLAAPFTVHEARALGVRSSRLRRTDLDRPFRGVRSVLNPDAAPSILDLCRAAQTVMDKDTFFSHTTAAVLYGLPIPWRHQRLSDLHVSVIAPRRAPKGAGVIGHKLKVERRTLRMSAGVRVPGPIEVWCELAAMLSVDELVGAGDALVRRKHPLAEPSGLRRAVVEAGNRPGVERLRIALPQIRARTDSPMETHLRLAIIRAGLPEPEVNAAILDEHGDFVAFGDLVFHASRVVVEFDGDHHRSDADQYFADIDRHWSIQRMGWHVVRINRSHLIGDAGEAVARVSTALTIG
jgi:hypothetical protein